MSYLFSEQCDTLIEGRSYQQFLIFSYRKDFDPEAVVAKIDSELSSSSFPNELVIAVPLVMVNRTVLQSCLGDRFELIWFVKSTFINEITDRKPFKNL